MMAHKARTENEMPIRLQSIWAVHSAAPSPLEAVFCVYAWTKYNNTTKTATTGIICIVFICILLYVYMGDHGISCAWWSSMSPNVNCLYSPLKFLPCLGQRNASQIMFWRVMRCHKMRYIHLYPQYEKGNEKRMQAKRSNAPVNSVVVESLHLDVQGRQFWYILILHFWTKWSLE